MERKMGGRGRLSKGWMADGVGEKEVGEMQ